MDPFTRHNKRERTSGQCRVSALSNMVTERRLRFFGHIARSAPDEDHHRAVAVVIRKPPSDWKRPPLQEDPTTRGSEQLNRI